MSDELWNKLTDLLNEMEAAGLAVNFGSDQDASTDWMSVPYVVSQRTFTVEVTWDRHEKRWKRGSK